MLVRSGAIDVVVVDSVAALTPKAEIEGEMGDSHVGLQARLMSQALRKLTGNIKRSNCCVIFINQIRMKIGVMFGSPETTTGGNALKFYASVRLDIRRTGSIKKGDEVIGNETKVKVVKNKVAPPFRQAEFDILYGQGISREGEIIDLGVAHGFVEKSGAWYSYDGNRIGQGKDNVRNYLCENPADRTEHRGQDPRQGSTQGRGRGGGGARRGRLAGGLILHARAHDAGQRRGLRRGRARGAALARRAGAFAPGAGAQARGARLRPATPSARRSIAWPPRVRSTRHVWPSTMSPSARARASARCAFAANCARRDLRMR